MVRQICAALVAAVAIGCGGRDAGSTSLLAGADAGVAVQDAGAPDAGVADAGPPDAGPVDAGPVDAGPADAGPRALLVPDAGRFYHGVFPVAESPQPDSDASPQALDAYEQAAGRRVAYVYFDDEWHTSRAFPIQTATWVRARGALPFIRLMLRSQRVPLITDPVFTLDRIIAGEFDGELAAWADQAKAFATPLVVEYGTEINGDWNPWSAPYNGGLDVGPAKFQRAYRHIVSVMRGRGADNITWALHYAGESFPDDPRNVPAAYYPGDDVIDWVGLSVYGSERSSDQRCPSFRSLVDAMLPQVRAATAVKPLFIFEFGNTSTNTGCPAGPWVKAAFDDILSGRWDLRGFAWWQQKFTDDASVGGTTDYLVQDDPAVMAAFRAALAGSQIVDRPLVK